MAALQSLPVEIIYMVCHELPLEALAALARTCQRLLSVVEPLLYRRGLERHFHLPLAWAAKRGIPGTLRKALAAGASPGHEFWLEMPWEVWLASRNVRLASAAWNSCDTRYWPPTEALEDLIEHPRWLRALTPTLTRLDVLSQTDPASSPRPRGSPQSPRVWRHHAALHLAAMEGHKDIVNILLDHGAAIDTSSYCLCPCRPPRPFWENLFNLIYTPPLATAGNWSALHVAICASQVETAKLLLSRGAQVAGGLGGDTAAYGALHQAAAAGHADLVTHILDTYPELDVNLRDDKELTPLYHAFANRRWDSTVPLLLARGADINPRFPVRYDGRTTLVTTPLGEACRLNRFEDAMKLFDLGADAAFGVEIRHDVRPTIHVPLLHLCCMNFDEFRDGDALDPESDIGKAIFEPGRMQKRFRTEMIARLVASGLSPNLTFDTLDRWEETPLSVAVQHRNIAAVKTLLDVGADVCARNSNGRNPLMVANAALDETEVQNGLGVDWSVFGFLPTDEWDPRLRNGDYPDMPTLVKLLLDAGIPVNDQDAQGNTALHLLFDGYYNQPDGYFNHPDGIGPEGPAAVLRTLLARGADPCIRNDKGVSALQLAVREQFLDAVETISRHGRIDLVDSFSLDEIMELFRETYHHDFSPRSRRRGDSAEAMSRRLIEVLLDMDRSRRLLSNGCFIRDCVLSDVGSHARPLCVVAEILCLGGLEETGLDYETKLDMFRFAVHTGQWVVAEWLLDGVRNIDINTEGDDDGETVLCTAVMAGAPMDFIERLLDAGANVHQYQIGQSGTPLDILIQCGRLWGPEFVECMLRKQPIRGNPEAAHVWYLHTAMVFLPRTRPKCPKPNYSTIHDMWEDMGHIIRHLLAAGADPTQTDDEGDTPLSLLLITLSEADPEEEQVKKACSWIKPLSRGVDVNRKNQDNMSVGDYLEKLMDNAEVKVFISRHLELLTLENGDKKIKWLI